MKLTSLKNAGDVDYCTPYTPPNYSGGLCLWLSEDQCEALGLTKALAAGTQVKIQAVGIVTTCTESVERDGDDAGPDISMSIQITDMGIEAGGKVRNAAEVLYGKAD